LAAPPVTIFSGDINKNTRENEVRILIVDDEPELVRKLQNILEKLGYTIDTAFDGEEAVERIYTDHYDLILLDIMLPKKTALVSCLSYEMNKKIPLC